MDAILSRRGFLAAAGAGLLAGRLRPAAAASRPNFVVIVGEGLGWTTTSVPMDDRWSASRGAAVRTPNLERLAGAGLRFAHGYAPSPRCTPSRAGLLTGISPARLHMTFINEEGIEERDGAASRSTRLLPPTSVMQLPTSVPTIGSVLRSAGYATAHFGKWHVGELDPREHGFDESDGPNGNRGPERTENPNPAQVGAITKLGCDFLARQARAGRPFLLDLCHYSGRKEQEVLPASLAAVRQRGVYEREAPGIAAIEEMDASIGQILDQLQALGLADNTYVVYTTDHGTPGRNTPLRGGKGTVWEGGLRVPFLVAGPGIAPGVCSRVRATGLDLLPTLAELAGVTGGLSPDLEGGSLAAVLHNRGEGSVTRPREEFVVHFPAYDKDPLGPASTLLLGDLKLVRHDEQPAPALYDLAADPGEQHDLAADRTDEAATLTHRLDAYLDAVQAQRVRPNPQFDPSRAPSSAGQRGGRGRPRP